MAEGKAKVDDVEIWWEDFGNPEHPTVMLVMGANAQSIVWPSPIIDTLVKAGYRVVRFDNRDIGLSTWVDFEKAPYDVTRMAKDAIGLLDALGVAKAHWIGASMGGMISQQIALDFPDRIQSLVSIMSSPSSPYDGELPPPDPKVMEAAAALGPDADPVESAVALFSTLAGDREAFDEVAFRRDFLVGIERGGYNPNCSHGLAVEASPSRTERLKGLRVPTLVIHGGADPILPLGHGEATAAAIPNASLLVMEGVGHDFPASTMPELIEAILKHLHASVAG